jgi:hypothetical protein
MTTGLHFTLLYGIAILLVVIPIIAARKNPKTRPFMYFISGLFLIGFTTLFILIEIN